MTKKFSATKRDQRAAPQSRQRLMSAVRSMEQLVMMRRYATLEALSGQWLRAYPKEGILWYMSGLAAFLSKGWASAVERMRTAADLGFCTAQFCEHLGLALAHSGQLQEASDWMRRGTRLDPERATILANLASVEYRLSNLDSAEDLARRSLELRPHLIEAGLTLSKVLDKKNRLSEAIAVLEAMNSQCPHDPDILFLLAHRYAMNGEIDQSIAMHRERVRIAPDDDDGRSKILVSAFEGDHETLMQIAGELERRLEGESKRNWYETGLSALAAGSALIRMGEQDRGFRLADAANRLIANHRPVAPDSAAVLNACRSCLSREFFECRSEFGVAEVPGIFVIGFSRSGKSLLESLMGLDGRIQSLGESHVFPDLIDQAFPWWKSDGYGTGQLALTDRREIREVAQMYLARCRQGSGLGVTTLPGNIFRLAFLGLLFPRAPIIVMRRDLLDLGVACYLKDYEFGHGFTHDLSALGREIKVWDELLDFWKEVLPNPIHEVRYENLVMDPNEVLTRVFQFLQLDWDPLILNMVEQYRESAQFLNLQESLAVAAPMRADFVGAGRALEAHLNPLKEGYRSGVSAEGAAGRGARR